MGRYSPRAALSSLRHFSDILDFNIERISGLTRRMTDVYADRMAREPNMADPFSEPFLDWLERLVLGKFHHSNVDRLVSGRFRIMAQSSTRHDDLKHTRPDSLKLIHHPDGSLRAILGNSYRTKTRPRNWICSSMGVKPGNNGWLESTIDLLTDAHGSLSAPDDHLGKRAYPDRSGWDLGPPDGQADTMHIRYLMLRASKSLDQPKFTDDQIRRMRHHGAKPTLTSAAQHYGVR